MHLVSRVIWSLMGTLACLGAIGKAAAGVLDIGVVFPRQNETYAPMERFPVIIALQNAQLATYLNLLIQFNIYNGSMTMLDSIDGEEFDLQGANYTTEPYLLYAFKDFRNEGPLKLRLEAWWRQCDMSGEEVTITTDNRTDLWVDFNIREGAQTADLVAATAEEETCPTHVGVAINVTDEGHDVFVFNEGNRRLSGNCSVVDSSSPTPDSNPCRVRIDEAAVESIEAEDLERRCSSEVWNPPPECPKKDHAFQQLAVAGGATVVGVVAAIVFLLA